MTTWLHWLIAVVLAVNLLGACWVVLQLSWQEWHEEWEWDRHCADALKQAQP